MQRVQFYAQTAAGAIPTFLPGATVYVYVTGTTTQYQLYESDGVTPRAQPIYADATTALVDFTAPAGTVDIQISSGAYTAPLISGYPIVDAVAAQNAAIAAAASATSASTSAANAAASANFVVNRAPVRLAQLTPLPANTYDNGSAGVGATITITAHAALSSDGFALVNGDRIWVLGEPTQANNGLFTQTTLGTGSVSAVLTRATDADTAAELGQACAQVTAGTVYAGWGFAIQQAAGAITMGTTAITAVGRPLAVGAESTRAMAAEAPGFAAKALADQGSNPQVIGIAAGTALTSGSTASAGFSFILPTPISSDQLLEQVEVYASAVGSGLLYPAIFTGTAPNFTAVKTFAAVTVGAVGANSWYLGADIAAYIASAGGFFGVISLSGGPTLAYAPSGGPGNYYYGSAGGPGSGSHAYSFLSSSNFQMRATFARAIWPAVDAVTATAAAAAVAAVSGQTALAAVELGSTASSSGPISPATGITTAANSIIFAPAEVADRIITGGSAYVQTLGTGQGYLAVANDLGGNSLQLSGVLIPITAFAGGGVRTLAGFSPFLVKSGQRLGYYGPTGGAQVSFVAGGSNASYVGNPGAGAQTYAVNAYTMQAKFDGLTIISAASAAATASQALINAGNGKKRAARTLVESSLFTGTSTPAGWTLSGGFTVNNGLIGPSSSPGYSVVAVSGMQVNADQKVTRHIIRALASGTIAGIAFKQNSTNIDNRIGSMFAVDFGANTLIIKNAWTGSASDPGNYVLGTIPFTLATNTSYTVLVTRNIRSNSITIYNPLTGAAYTLSDGLPNTAMNIVTGEQADYLCYINIAGQMKCLSSATFLGYYNAGAWIGGDSLSDGYEVTESQRYDAIVRDAALSTVVISGRSGDKAAGFYARASSELAMLLPRVAGGCIGTNDTDSNLSAYQTNITAWLAQCASLSIKPWLTRLPPFPSRTYTSINAWLDTLGITLVDAARAMTVSNDQVTPDPTYIIAGDGHWTPAGHALMAQLVAAQVPEIFD